MFILDFFPDSRTSLLGFKFERQNIVKIFQRLIYYEFPSSNNADFPALSEDLYLKSTTVTDVRHGNFEFSKREIEAPDTFSRPYFPPRNENSAARLILPGIVLASCWRRHSCRGNPRAVQFKRRHANAWRHRRKAAGSRLSYNTVSLTCYRHAYGNSPNRKHLSTFRRSTTNPLRRRGKEGGISRAGRTSEREQGCFVRHAQRPRLCA
jgi:hypothetical protein